MDANQLSVPNLEQKSGAARGLEVTRAKDARNGILLRLKELNETDPNPKLGECAAAKLIARPPAKGHVPAAMTEMYFSPEGVTWTRSYEVLTKIANPEAPLIEQLSNAGATPRAYEFKEAAEQPGPADSVASCTTCQTALPLVLCNTEDSTC